MKDIVKIYQKCKNFDEAVKLSGLPTLQAHIKLLRSGVLTINDKIQYSSRSGQLGALAEQKFQELMPDAVNYNEVVKTNNPIFDFKYGNLTIDVKYSSLHFRPVNQVFWSIRPTKADIVVGFLEKRQGSGLDGAYLVVIPTAFIQGQKSFHITKESAKEFIVTENELKEVISIYNDFKEKNGSKRL